MPVELDHIIICTSAGGLEGNRLVQFGLQEAPANRHPGQGTANRRFAFANAMIELLWVWDAVEAQSEATARTLLWERWSGRQQDASPFGFCVRPVGHQDLGPPFSAWAYRPRYLPEPWVLHIGEAGVEEPMWVYLGFMRRQQRERWFAEHPAGIREITGLRLGSPAPLRSDAALILMQQKVLEAQAGEPHLLEIEFDGNRRQQRADFRPDIPVVFRF